MNPPTPATFKELFNFYYDFVKPLHSLVQTENEIPSQVLFELSAAQDHISRHFYYSESESVVCDKAFSHFKRACLDMFKLRLRVHTEQWKMLTNVDTSIISNGKFEGEMIALRNQIVTQAREARKKEGDPRMGFDLWSEVYELCKGFESEFFLNPAVGWAKIKVKKRTLISRASGVAIGFVVGVAATLVGEWIRSLIHPK